MYCLFSANNLPVETATAGAGGDCGDATDVAETGVSAFVGEFNVSAAGAGPNFTFNMLTT